MLTVRFVSHPKSAYFSANIYCYSMYQLLQSRPSPNAQNRSPNLDPTNTEHRRHCYSYKAVRNAVARPTVRKEGEREREGRDLKASLAWESKAVRSFVRPLLPPKGRQAALL